METQHNISQEEAQLHQLIEKGVKAIQAKDVDTLLPLFASDVVSFDLIGPLHYIGAEAVGKRMHEWFSSFEEGPLGYEISDLNINLAADMAFSYRFNHVSGQLRTGQQLAMRWRETTCYKKREGHWLIVHQHGSVPFDPQSGKASLSLEP